jgi:integrase
LSKATVYSTLNALKAFFIWLAGQPGYKSRITYADAEYFNLNLKDARIAKASRELPVPTLEQILHTIRTMPSNTDVDRRDQAVVAFVLSTGARDGAVASLKLKHIDMERNLVEQDAREVRTKFSKSFPTYFFPVGAEVVAIVAAWVQLLHSKLLFGFDDPLFPATRVAVGTDGLFGADGLSRRPWSNGAPIRAIFKDAFARAGLPYFPPLSFRKTLAQLGQKKCGGNIEAMKAWSQNLGHEELMTTFTSYGALSRNQQAEIIASLGQNQAS